MSDQLCPRCKAESETLHTLCACSACGATIRASREVGVAGRVICRACASVALNASETALNAFLDALAARPVAGRIWHTDESLWREEVTIDMAREALVLMGAKLKMRKGSVHA